mmetsp:Transcript_62644/g.93161  ORF Transcript_62644/g.93161 Transcript_62644/m.93161 type:complete len:103 (+) Transcript_62644:94-402(+)
MKLGYSDSVTPPPIDESNPRDKISSEQAGRRKYYLMRLGTPESFRTSLGKQPQQHVGISPRKVDFFPSKHYLFTFLCKSMRQKHDGTYEARVFRLFDSSTDR